MYRTRGPPSGPPWMPCTASVPMAHRSPTTCGSWSTNPHCSPAPAGRPLGRRASSRDRVTLRCAPRALRHVVASPRPRGSSTWTLASELQARYSATVAGPGDDSLHVLTGERIACSTGRPNRSQAMGRTVAGSPSLGRRRPRCRAVMSHPSCGILGPLHVAVYPRGPGACARGRRRPDSCRRRLAGPSCLGVGPPWLAICWRRGPAPGWRSRPGQGRLGS